MACKIKVPSSRNWMHAILQSKKGYALRAGIQILCIAGEVSCIKATLAGR